MGLGLFLFLNQEKYVVSTRVFASLDILILKLQTDLIYIWNVCNK